MNREDSKTANVSPLSAKDTIGNDVNINAEIDEQDTCGTSIPVHIDKLTVADCDNHSQHNISDNVENLILPVPVHIDKLTMADRDNHSQRNGSCGDEKIILSEANPDYKQECNDKDNEKLISGEDAQDYNEDDSSTDEILNSHETDQDQCIYITPPTTNDRNSADDSTSTICSDSDITDIRSIKDNVSDDQNIYDSPDCKPSIEGEWPKIIRDTFLNKKVKPIDIMHCLRDL